jgi:hypothetical protein
MLGNLDRRIFPGISGKGACGRLLNQQENRGKSSRMEYLHSGMLIEGGSGFKLFSW